MIGMESEDFSGMGLGSFDAFAPTSAQMQRRLGTVGVPSYTPPRPASVAPSTRISPTTSNPAPVTMPTSMGQPNTTATAPKPVTQPKRSTALQKRLDEIEAEVARKRQAEIAKGPRVVDNLRNTTPNMTEFRKALRTGYTGDNVDRVDDFYNMTFLDVMHDPEGGNIYLPDATDFAEKGAMGIPLTKEEQMLNISSRAYFGQDGLPGYETTRFYEPPSEKDYTDARKAEVSAITGTIGDATSTGQIVDTLSSYYGADVKPIKETRSFTGDIEGYTSTSPELMAEFQSVIRPLMEEKVAYGMSVGKKDYHETILDAYNNDPVIRAVYDKYGVKPTRTNARGSEYIYDPLGYRDSRVIKRSPALGNAIKMAATLAFTAGAGGALAGTAAFGGGTSALGTAAAKGLTSAAVTAATGGEGSDILKAGLLGGAGAYGQELAKAAEAADLAAAAGAMTAESPQLIKAAELARKTSDTFNKVAKTAKFVDAAIDGDIAGAAVAAFGPRFTKTAMDKVGLDEKFLDRYNINQDDAVAGLVKTQLELTKGTDFGDAVARGFGKYITEGGALAPNNVKTPEFIQMIGDAIKATGSMFDDVLLQPIKGVVEPVIDVARDIGSAADDAFIQPIREGLKVVDDEAIQPIKEGFETVYESIPNLGVDLSNLPDVNLPASTQTASTSSTPSTRRSAPRIIQERTADIVDLGEERYRKVDPVAAYLASITGSGMANGGAVRSSYGNLDELLRIVEGK